MTSATKLFFFTLPTSSGNEIVNQLNHWGLSDFVLSIHPTTTPDFQHCSVIIRVPLDYDISWLLRY